MNIQDIIDWCKANDQVDWLKETAATPVTSKSGNTHQITFIELKIAFVEKFMPEIAPEKKVKKPSMYEIIANL
jgi:hypothetical protein